MLCWGVGSDFNIADRGVGEVLKAAVGVGRVDFPESGWDLKIEYEERKRR